jgi:hypothetical protein
MKNCFVDFLMLHARFHLLTNSLCWQKRSDFDKMFAIRVYLNDIRIWYFSIKLDTVLLKLMLVACLSPTTLVCSHLSRNLRVFFG